MKTRGFLTGGFNRGNHPMPLYYLLVSLALIQTFFAALTTYYESSTAPLLTFINYLAVAIILVSITAGLRTINVTLARFFFLSSFLFVVLVEAAKLGLLAFSGKGFTSEVFYHFEPTSIAVGWSEYKFLITMGLIIAVPLTVFFSRQLRVLTLKPRNWPFYASLLGLGIVGFVGTADRSPLVQAASAWMSYQAYSLETSKPDLEDFQPYIDLQVVNSTDILKKNELEVDAPLNPKNLILIYLESFNFGLTSHPDYPQLTPFINELQQSYAFTSRHYTSAYVTIEGLISSQCGTLLPMFRANDTFMDSSKSMPAMACLSDILKEAGYSQYYFGGTKEEFAGTNRFLAAHGYDEIRGWNYWKSKGKEQEFEYWGLGDSDLFNEAHEAIKKFSKSKTLFNMTIATMGTHVPGFMYGDCSPYSKDADPFLNAVHCTDQLLNQFITGLEEDGLLENTLVFIMGDHGVFATKRMRNIFGDMVDDQRILTLAFPAPQLENDWIMGGYDVAPTLLDLLEIEHNQNFLYGRSVIGEGRGETNYVTRYDDWIEGTLRENPQGECTDKLEIGEQPMNHCHKSRLLQLTQRILNTFGERPSDHLSCIFFDLLRVSRKGQSQEYTVTVSGKNAYRTFTSGGAYVRDTMAGFYLVELNGDNDILGKTYYPLDSSNQSLLSDQLQFWDDENPMILIYLPEESLTIIPALEESAGKLGISFNDHAVYVYQPQNKENSLISYPIANFPFSLDRQVCNELFQ